jgi:hypothetical protein
MSKETSNAREGDSTEGCRQGVGRDPAHIAAGGGELDPIAQLAQQDIPMSPSSSDLVERLRNRVAPEIALEREAADTIQRLEAAAGGEEDMPPPTEAMKRGIYGEGSPLVERIRNRPNDAPLPTEYLLDEAADTIQRLEAALEKIADWDVLGDGYTDFCEVRNIARAALAGKK